MSWRKKNPKKHKGYQSKWREENQDRIAQYSWIDYGVKDMTLARYEEMFSAQGGVCKICQRPEPAQRRLAVDHDHKTGLVRGLLCTRCNIQLGWYEKFPEEIPAYLVETPIDKFLASKVPN